jgi:hypothetical protein
MRIVLSAEDLAFFDRVPETLQFTLEPASDCNGVACRQPGAPFKYPVPHLHVRLSAQGLEMSRLQFVEIEG